MDDLDLDALSAKAQAATPGPWEVKPYTGESAPEYVGPIAGEEIITELGDTVLTQLGCSCCDFGLEGRPEDAAHITAFDPPTVLALIERVRAAEAKLERVRALHARHENTIHTTPEWVCSHRHCIDDAGDQCAWPCKTARAIGMEEE